MGHEIIPNSKSCKIDGLRLTPLKRICDSRGSVMHFLKSDSLNYIKFGEAYFSTIKEGVIKGWKYHKILKQNLCVPYGSVKIVVYDNRKKSNTYGVIDEIYLDNNENYFLLTMPSNLWYSFKCISEKFSIIANIIDNHHSINETIIEPLNSKNIPYVWS